MTGLALIGALVLSATPAERQAAFLKTHLDGSSAKLKFMRSEFKALEAHWLKIGAQKKREELALHFADELESATVPPEIARLGAEAVVTFKESLREEAAELRRSVPDVL